MLQHIDTVLAFSMIMLLLSLGVTAIVQFAVSLFGLRGRNLLWGVRQLVTVIAPDLEARAPELATAALTHPILGTSTNRIMQLVDWTRDKRGLSPRFKKGVRAPTGIQAKQLVVILRQVRDSLDADSRQKLQDIEGKVSDWFDVVMDACAEKFKLWTRWITVGAAAMLVFGFNVDAREIYAQLTTSPALRASIVAQAANAERLGGQGLEGDAAADFSGHMAAIRTQLEATELEIFKPGDPREITTGEVLALLLLSLGAPFWYGVLGKLLSFRSIAAERGEQARQAEA